MVSISSLLSPECVLLSPEVLDKSSLIRMLIETLEGAGKVSDKESLFKDVMDRENLSSTGLDYGCAIPHAQSSALKETVLAAALLDEGIDFNSPCGDPSRVIFLVAGPKDQAGQHLKLLSKMARILHDHGFMTSLEKAASASEFCDLIKQREG